MHLDPLIVDCQDGLAFDLQSLILMHLRLPISGTSYLWDLQLPRPPIVRTYDMWDSSLLKALIPLTLQGHKI